jgi:hypothetical protein
MPSSAPIRASALASTTSGPLVYVLYAAKTLDDVWREWDSGILGGPALTDLEATWGDKWRRSGAERTAWCRRKTLVDELVRRVSSGLTPAEAIANLEVQRGSRSLPSFRDWLVQQKERQRQ